MLRRHFTGSLLLLPLLAGCGFHLRGAALLRPDYDPVLLRAPAGSRIAAALKQALLIGGTILTTDRSRARLLVRVLDEHQDERVMAVDSNGKVIGIQLRYRVAFDALAADGRELAPRQELVLTRDFVNPDIEVTARVEEAELIRRDLVQDLADRILRRLKAQLP